MLMGRQWSKRDRGFSFIEVLIVVDKLQDARINAIKRNSQVWLSIRGSRRPERPCN